MIRTLGLALLLSGLHAPALVAQQWTTDDTGTVSDGSCQLEVWHGQRTSSVIPACAPLPGLELSVGAGWADDESGRHTLSQYAVQAKAPLGSLPSAGVDLSLAAGAALSPGGRFGNVYLYLPAGVSAWDRRVTAYANLGWRFTAGGSGHDLLYGVRGDLLLTSRIGLIMELFGARGDALPTELQGGVRLSLVPDRVQADVSYGRYAATGANPAGAGWTVGMAFTPAPWFAAAR